MAKSGANQLSNVAEQIKRLEQYGSVRYAQLMQTNRTKGQQTRGFWQQCREV